MASQFAIVSWILATVVSTSVPIALSVILPDLPRPPAFAIATLAGGLVLYPLARRTARRHASDLPFWKFFPAPFTAAVVTMLGMGLLGG